jgi:hypothetical protein
MSRGGFGGRYGVVRFPCPSRILGTGRGETSPELPRALTVPSGSRFGEARSYAAEALL